MGISIAFYVRNKGESMTSAISEKFPSAQVEVGSEFIRVPLEDNAFEPPADRLSELSSFLNTDVIWLSFQSTVDAFEFHHWREGTILRSLIFGCYKEERTWERVDGQPEPWEREAFFSEKALGFELKYADAGRKEELRRIWREAELLPGMTEPNIDSRDAAWKVAEHYNFPGWG